MKRILLLGLLTFISTLAYAQTNIQVGSGEYAPFTSKKIYKEGFVSHVIREAFKSEGINVTFVYMPWERNKVATRDGKFVASAYWQCSAAHQKDFLCSKPVQSGEFSFFYLKSKPLDKWSSFDDLKGFRIGATRGYSYTDEFWAAGKSGQIKLDIVASDETNMRKLLAGRIHLFPIEPAVGFNLLRAKFGEASVKKVDFNKKPLTVTDTSLLFPKSLAGSAALLEKFDRGLQALKDDGRYEKMNQDLLAGKYDK